MSGLESLKENLEKLRLEGVQREQARVAEESTIRERVEAVDVSESELPEAGAYTQDDMATNDVLYSIIEKHVLDRSGIQEIKDKTREEVVDTFLQNRRGVVGLNTVRGLNEYDFIEDIQNDPDKLARAGQAYSVYNNMAGVFNPETTILEKAGSLVNLNPMRNRDANIILNPILTPKERRQVFKDNLQSAILDPFNAVSSLAGKFIGGGILRKGTSKLIEKHLAKQGSKVMTNAATRKIFKEAAREAGKKTQDQIGIYSSKLMNSRGFKRLATSGAVKEIATTTTLETAVNVGMEALYQNGLIKTGVEEDYDNYSLGTIALGSIIVGGAQAGKVISRGEIGAKLSPIEITGPEKADQVMKDLTQNILKLAEIDIPISEKWTSRVGKGQELTDLDTDFFIDLLLGKETEGGEVIWEGISSIAARNNIYWVKDVDNNVGNWVAEIIKQSRPEDISDFVDAFSKATGNKLEQIKTMTPEVLANTFANKISQSARNLNALKQVADKNSVSLDDLDIETFLSTELDLPFNILKRDAEDIDPTLFNQVMDMTPLVIQNNQDRLIRLLVSNPSTSSLNLVGYGAHTTLNTVSDIAIATLYAGKGTLQKGVFLKKQGEESTRIAKELIKSTFFKGRIMLDPDLTYAAFEGAMARNSKALQQLSDVLPGGVDNAVKLLTNDKFTAKQKLRGQKLDNVVDLIQTVSLVKAQDKITKATEFLAQMDKSLRLSFGKGWNEFYSSPDASKIMATKEYGQIEAQAVLKVQEAIFSKSYKGEGKVAYIAGVIEDLRTIPGIGLQVPFGRFFNNTVDFGLQATGLSTIGKLTGFYPDKKMSELAVKGAAGLGLIYAMTDQEIKDRKNGLGLYQTSVGGQIINQQYDYPVSLFKGLARINSYWKMGEEPPKELLTQMARDFTLDGLLRNVEASQKEIAELTYRVFQLDIEQSKKAAMEILKGTGSQSIASLTRFAEPYTILGGVVMGENARPIDRYQGDKFVNDAFKYFDNIMPVFVGERPTLQQAASGEADVQTAKILGVRPLRLSNTQRVMQMLGYDTFSLNAERKIRTQAPKVANEYNRILFDIIEAKAKALMESEAFVGMKTSDQRRHWAKKQKNAKEAARNFLVLQFSDSEGGIDKQFKITSRYSRDKIDDAREALDLGELHELERDQLTVLEEYMRVFDTLEELRVNEIMSVD